MTCADVSATALLSALKNAKLFAALPKAYRTTIQQSEWTFTKNGIQIVTTDSFALLIEQVEATVPDEMVGQVRHAAVCDMAPLIATLKGRGRHGRAVLLVDDDSLSIGDGNGVNGTLYRFTSAGAFPTWAPLIPDGLFEGGISAMDGPLGLGLSQLKRIGSIECDVAPARFYAIDALKVVGTEIGSTIRVLQMPVRIP